MGAYREGRGGDAGPWGGQRSHSNQSDSSAISEVMPSATKARCTTDAAETPATVTSVRQPPWAIELATISAFAGPGTTISTAVASTKAR